MPTQSRETYENGVLVATTTDEIPQEVVNERTLRDNIAAAYTANRAFVALAAPTNAQTLAQVKALTRQMNGLMRLVNQQFDATD